MEFPSWSENISRIKCSLYPNDIYCLLLNSRTTYHYSYPISLTDSIWSDITRCTQWSKWRYFFQDKSLSDGIFFLELLSAVYPRAVNWSLVTKGDTGISLELECQIVLWFELYVRSTIIGNGLFFLLSEFHRMVYHALIIWNCSNCVIMYK